VTVDCGIASRSEITLAKSLGMDVVVTDHHRVPRDFEAVCPVVNPQRPDSAFPFRHLSGVGLAFFLVVALRAAMRQRHWFRNRPEPDLRAYLILVALGTAADMVPLVDQNRILAVAGLQRMDLTLWPGIEALQEVAGTGDARPFQLEELAFTWAPRLNAPGRLGAADVALSSQHVSRISQHATMPLSIILRRLSLVLLILSVVLIDVGLGIRRRLIGVADNMS